MSPILIDIMGYTASALVALSIAMSSIFWLRVLNMSGAFVFVIYGSAIEAWPVVALNALLVAMNLYHLLKLKKAAEIGSS